LGYVIDSGSRRTITKSAFFTSLTVVIVTMVLIVAQNDTGTLLFFTAFFFVMYREGIIFDQIVLFFTNNILKLRFKQTWVGTHFIPVLFVVIVFSIIILYFTDSKYDFLFLPGYDVPGWFVLIFGMTVVAVLIFMIAKYFAS